MKILKSFFAITIILFVTLITQAQEVNFSKLTGPYLSQKPPGMTPEIFAPGIISVDSIFEHSPAIFSPNLSEVYWCGKPVGTRFFKIYFMKIINGRWTEPKIAFSHKDRNYNNPVFSSDGNKLFFDSEGDIWFVERISDDWTKPVKIPSVINSDESEVLRSITANGSIYFSRYNANASSEGRKHEIYISRKINGNYIKPEKLDKNINSDDMKEYSAYVAPDESYMIFHAMYDSRHGDLFISYKGKDNTWLERIKLPFNAMFASVSPDGKYLFFITHDGIYWVSAKIFDEFKPKE